MTRSGNGADSTARCSAIDKAGEPFHSPKAFEVYRYPLKRTLSPTIKLVELDAHINDENFAQAATDLLLDSIATSERHS